MRGNSNHSFQARWEETCPSSIKLASSMACRRWKAHDAQGHKDLHTKQGQHVDRIQTRQSSAELGIGEAAGRRGAVGCGASGPGCRERGAARSGPAVAAAVAAVLAAAPADGAAAAGVLAASAGPPARGNVCPSNGGAG